MSEAFKPLFDYSPAQVLAALSQGFGEDFVGSHKAMIPCETPVELNRPLLPVLAVFTRAGSAIRAEILDPIFLS